MQNIFSNFYGLHLYLLTLISNNFNRNNENWILGKWNHEFTDAILLIHRQLERATIAEGVRKLNSHPFKVMQKDKHVDCFMVSCISHICILRLSKQLVV